jgi:hypothetical protein
VVEDAQRGADFVARMPTSQVAIQGFNRLACRLLQPSDSGFHDAAPGLAKSSLKRGKAQPAVQGCFAHAGLRRRSGVRRLSQQRRN